MFKRFAARTLIGVIAIMTLVSLAVERRSSAHAREHLTVVTTTGMIADAARQIGGSAVKVDALMGPGVDPHSYRQTRTDIVALSRADLVLWHGLYLEAQLEQLLKQIARQKAVVAVAERLPQNVLLNHDDYAGKFDPHIWMRPDLWSRVVIAIRDALIDARPQNEAMFRANTDTYLVQLAQLSAYSKRVLSSIPTENRVLLTAHDAFNYFGEAYNFEVIGIQGISTESEAGLKRILDLVNLITQRKIRAVFVESSVSNRNIRALIEGAAARKHTVKIGGELFSDAMGKAGTYQGTYIGLIDHNVTTITRALGGQAPAKGMQEKLS